MIKGNEMVFGDDSAFQVWFSREEFDALEEFLRHTARDRKRRGQSPAEPIEAGQVWATAESSPGGPNWMVNFAVEITRVLDEWVYFVPLQLNATEGRCTRHDFPILYARIPYRREEV